MKFWIDIVEPFSLNFLAVVINRLKELNHTVTITAPARQVLLSELDSKKIEYIMIDNRVNGRSRADRLGDLGRALRLAEFALDSRFDLGFSTGSLPQTIACNMVGLANLVIYDFSQKPPWLLLKLRTKMLVPDCIIDSLPEKIKEKVVGYPGFKESIYLGAVKYNHHLEKELGLDRSRVVYLIRPDPRGDGHSHRLIEKVIAHLVARRDTQILLDVWNIPHKRWFKRRWSKIDNLIWLEEKKDSAELISIVDGVLSSDPIMVREAVLLGVPTYLVTAGPSGPVEDYLIRLNRLCLVQSAMDILQIRPAKCNGREPMGGADQCLEVIIKEIEKARNWISD